MTRHYVPAPLLVRRAALATVLALACVPPSGATRAATPRTAAPTAGPTADPVERHFAFHSGAWLNLHHFLHAVARARSGYDTRRPAIVAALTDTAGLGDRPVEEQRAWEAAVEYYRTTYAAREATFDPLLIAAKNRLAAAEEATSLHGVGLDPRHAAVLERAAPVYHAVWWPRHDTANRAWISSMRPLLARYEDTLAAELVRVLDAPWPAFPLRVDVVAYANWAGAYTTVGPPHVTVSSLARGYGGTLGLEMLFHEASHAMDDTLRTALGPDVPYDVTHAILFYTAGELTRRLVPGHVPYAEAEGLWSRRPFGPLRAAIARGWEARLDGSATLHDAARAVTLER